MAWTGAGVEQMARLRLMEADGGSVKETYLESAPSPKIRVCERRLENALEQLRHSSSLADMGLGNMPALSGPYHLSLVAHSACLEKLPCTARIMKEQKQILKVGISH